MPKPRWNWAVLADDSRAKLLHCGPAPGTPGDRPHIDHVDQLRTSWEGHQRGRPSPLKYKTHKTHAAPGHEQEEDRRRFAQELANWLEKQVKQHDIESLTVFAPSRFLNALRKACSQSLTKRLNEQPAELINLPNQDLHRHPAILQLIGLDTESNR